MINSITLVGRLTKDPDLKYTPNGVPVATLTLAVNRNFKNGSGETEADFINCVVWRKPAENVANYLSKGSLAGVVGRIQTRNFEGQDGKRVYITEVVAESVQFLETKKNNSGQEQQGGQERSDNRSNYNNMKTDPFANNGEPIDISDDDLPF